MSQEILYNKWSVITCVYVVWNYREFSLWLDADDEQNKTFSRGPDVGTIKYTWHGH